MKRRPDDFALRCLLVTSALLTACGRSRSAAVRAGVDTSWLIAREPARDAIHASDSETSLRARYGDSNVVAGVVELGEGKRETGALFPHDSTRRLTVLWRDTLRRAGAKRARIGGAPTRWLVTPGITLGTSLAELERLNGRPFRLFGMGFDYSGTVESWEGGRLDTLWRPSPGVLPCGCDCSRTAAQTAGSFDRSKGTGRSRRPIQQCRR